MPMPLSLGFSLCRLVIIITDAHRLVCGIVVRGKELRTQGRGGFGSTCSSGLSCVTLGKSFAFSVSFSFHQ